MATARSGKMTENQRRIPQQTQARQKVEAVFAQQIAAQDEAALHFRLTTLVRLITGYFLQRVLNGEQAADVERESREISLMVKLYLRDLGVDI